MTRCAHCRKRVGLGALSKRFWEGGWFKYFLFCSMSSRNAYAAKYEEERIRRLAVKRLFSQPP